MDARAHQISRSTVRNPFWHGREHFCEIARQRLPFCPLVMAAAGGILCGTMENAWLMAAAALALLAVAYGRGGLWFFLCGVFAGFAALAGWNGAAARSLAAARPGPEIATVEGTVISEPRPAGAQAWAFDCRVQWANFGEWQGPLDVPIAMHWAGAPPKIGDCVRVVGTWEHLRAPRNPGAFDSSRWHELRGIFSQVRVSHPADAQVAREHRGFSFRRMAAEARQWIIGALTRGLEPESPQAHLIVAMTLGDTRPLDESLLEDFRGTGTFHLFSVSGLHVGMLGLLLWMVLRTFRLNPRAAAGLIIPALFFYALMTGWKPASVRAATMAGFVLAGLMLGRPPVVLNSLCAAAFFILLADPRQLFNPGFQLSFGVVFALVLLAPPLEKALRNAVAPDPLIPQQIYHRAERWRAAAANGFAPLAAVAVASWIGSTPLTMVYFHLISWAAVPANMVCVPLAFCVMAVAMMSVATGWLWPWLGVIFNNTNWALASLLLGVVQSVASWPWSFVFVGPPLPRGTLQLTVMDFGAGAAQVVEAGGRSWLFDSGPLREFDRTLRPFLRSRGIGRLDGLVLSHGDAAHVGAAGEVTRYFRPQIIAASPLADRSPTRRSLFTQWQAEGQGIAVWRAGDFHVLAPGLQARVLYPPPEIISDVADDKAMVVALEFGRWRILLLADAGPATEAWLVTHARESLRADVVIKGAHRSGVAMSEEFLDGISPRLVIATQRPFPASEKIPPETRTLLGARGIPVFALDEHGAVTVKIRGTQLKARGFKSGSEISISPTP